MKKKKYNAPARYLVFQVHPILRHNLRAVNLRRHVDIITKMLVGQELHRAGDKLSFVHREGIFE